MKKSFYCILFVFSVMVWVAVSQVEASQMATCLDNIGSFVSANSVDKDTAGSFILAKGNAGNGGNGVGKGSGNNGNSGSSGNAGSGTGTGTGKQNGGKASGFGPGDGTGTGIRPKDGTGNGNKFGNCTQTK